MSDPFNLSTTRTLLETSLAAAVPLWALELKDRPWDWLQERAQECSQYVAEKGDVILFRGKKGDSAAAFNRLAEGLAILSFVPGGVKIFGSHWDFGYLRDGEAGDVPHRLREIVEVIDQVETQAEQTIALQRIREIASGGTTGDSGPRVADRGDDAGESPADSADVG